MTGGILVTYSASADDVFALVEGYRYLLGRSRSRFALSEHTRQRGVNPERGIYRIKPYDAQRPAARGQCPHTLARSPQNALLGRQVRRDGHRQAAKKTRLLSSRRKT